MKLKKLLKIKNQLKLASYILTSYLILMITLTGLIEVYSFVTDPIKQEMIAEVLVPSVHAEPSMKEYVKLEIEKAGLSWEEVDCLIQNESGWDNWKYGINTNGSTDFGLWQWNSVNKATVSVECRWDYKFATKKAIEKRIRDRNWEAWYGYTNNCK